MYVTIDVIDAIVPAYFLLQIGLFYFAHSGADFDNAVPQPLVQLRGLFQVGQYIVAQCPRPRTIFHYREVYLSQYSPNLFQLLSDHGAKGRSEAATCVEIAA